MSRPLYPTSCIATYQFCRTASSITQASIQTLQKQVDECNISIQGMIQSLPQINSCRRQRNQRKTCSATTTGQSRVSILQPFHRPPYPDNFLSEAPHSLDMCICYRSSGRTSVRRGFIVGPLTFFYQADAHADNCPFRKAPARKRCGVTARLRFSTGLNITLAFQSISNGLILQLTPQIIASRIVDRKASPVFLSLAQMGKDLCKATGKSCAGESWWLSSLACQMPDRQESEYIRRARAALREVFHKLEYSFRAGLASARDEDESGSTLLHVYPLSGYFGC